MKPEYHYVKQGSKIIEVRCNEVDELFSVLWEHNDVEKEGADTDFENEFGPLTHYYTNGFLIPVHKGFNERKILRGLGR
jgi:hypothetical protein